MAFYVKNTGICFYVSMSSYCSDKVPITYVCKSTVKRLDKQSMLSFKLPPYNSVRRKGEWFNSGHRLNVDVVF